MNDFFKRLAEKRVVVADGAGAMGTMIYPLGTPERGRDRVLAAARITTAERMYVNPDCGLRTRNGQGVFAQLDTMVRGVELARKEIGLNRPPPPMLRSLL